MTDKLKISQAVIVEGKYDKIKLSSVIDALIVETNGFGVFKDKERMAYIKKLANERGIAVLTDSDHAGFMIRGYISSGIPKDKIFSVYIPDVYGKEKRKDKPSKEGKLGVEGMSSEIILEAFKKANLGAERTNNTNPVTTADLFEAGLSGTPDAKNNKKRFLKTLGLPEYLSTPALIQYINSSMTKEEFEKITAQLDEKE